MTLPLDWLIYTVLKTAILTNLAVANVISLWPAAIFHIWKFQGVTVCCWDMAVRWKELTGRNEMK